MILLSVYFRAPPDMIDELRPAMATVIAASRAEPGCIFYSLAEDVADRGVIRAFEIYRDDEALAAHAASDHFKAWRAVSGQYPREERRLFDGVLRA